MAYNLQTSIDISFQSGADLSNNQFCFVKLDSTSQLQACDASSFAIGVLTNQPSVGADGQYGGTAAMVGVTRVCVGGVYPIGTFLCPGTDGTIVGLGYSVADASSNDRYIRAVTLQASTAAYDVVAAQLIDVNPGVTSTSVV